MKNKKATLFSNEWKKSSVKQRQENAILTAQIWKGTFGITPSEYAKLKNVKRENLRNNLTPLELIFTALGEEVTRKNILENNAKNFKEKYFAAQKGGQVAGEALKRFEAAQNTAVLSI